MRSAFCSRMTIGFLLGLLLAIPSSLRSAERIVDTEAPLSPADFVKYVFAITDVVLDHHIDPPTRQEMILAGLKVALAESKSPPMPNLGRRVSDVKTTDDLLVLLNDVWRVEKQEQAPYAKAVPPDFESQFVRGLLNSVPGGPYLVPAKEALAQAQLQDNRYVGLGIALGMDGKQKLARISSVISGGTAEAGGIHEGDLIEAIDHVDVTPGTPIPKIIERLRGADGTTVTLRLRAEKSETSRTATLARLPVMIKSVDEVPVPPELAGSVSFRVAHLDIRSVTASTAQELRSWEARLRHSGAQAVILDFRNVGGFRGETDHAALLLADSLLDGALIGKVRTRESTREFRADRDCLFRDWPLAVLVNERTSGPAEWVAAALQDAHREGSRAILVGRPSRGDNFVKRAIPLPGRDESMVLATGMWERPDAERQNRDMREPSQIGSGRLSWRVIPDLLVAKTDAPAKGGNANRPIAAVKRPKKPAAAVASNAMAIAQNSYAPKGVRVVWPDPSDRDTINMAIGALAEQWNSSHRAANSRK
jgi:C-terminal processing protease CtpA/Prc